MNRKQLTTIRKGVAFAGACTVAVTIGTCMSSLLPTSLKPLMKGITMIGTGLIGEYVARKVEKSLNAEMQEHQNQIENIIKTMESSRKQEIEREAEARTIGFSYHS